MSMWQLLVNGVAVTLKGVNRHEHDSLRGKCVDEVPDFDRTPLLTIP